MTDGLRVLDDVNTHANAGPAGADSAAVAGPTPLPQICGWLRLRFEPQDAAACRQLDAWFDEVLEPAGPEHDSSPESALVRTPADATALAWLQRVLRLLRFLLQVLQVPLFDPLRVHALAAEDGAAHYQAQVSAPLLNDVGVPRYTAVLREALAIAKLLSTHAVDERLVQEISERVQGPLARRHTRRAAAKKSVLPLLREAHRRSIPFESLGGGVFQLGWGARAQRLFGSVSARDSAIGARLAADKAATAALLRRAGLPAAEHVVCIDRAAARHAAQGYGWPVVVKPQDSDRGEGVSVGVRDEAQLDAAFDTARSCSASKSVLVERTIPGVCHRLFIAQGRLLYAVKRLPMSVVGDGASDIATLVAAEVARQRLRPTWQRSGIEPLDALALASLREAGLTAENVPAAGQWVALRPIESTAWGGVDEEVSDAIHPTNLAAALDATALLGLDIAGVDFISPDITVPWHANGARINELNFSPLLGGGEISRRHLGVFLDRFIEGDGTVPVEVFAGGPAAARAAHERWQRLRAEGRAAFFADAQHSLDATGGELLMPGAGLCAHARALVLNTRMEYLVLLVQDDELLRTPWPLPGVTAVHVVDNNFAYGSGELLPRAQRRALLQRLRLWPRLSANRIG